MPVAMSFRIRCHHTRFNASSEGDALQRCEARLTLAEDAKQRGAQHYDRSAFATSVATHGDALTMIEDAADALRALRERSGE